MQSETLYILMLSVSPCLYLKIEWVNTKREREAMPGDESWQKKRKRGSQNKKKRKENDCVYCGEGITGFASLLLKYNFGMWNYQLHGIWVIA